jgi:predicted transport protein
VSDIKLFKVNGTVVDELQGQAVALERELQSLMEAQLETFLGVRFLDTEYSTGKTHGGRIDSLGIDENNCPVIIEYKRSSNENVINQGLFYLDWLMDHRGEFTLLVQKKLGVDASEQIDWSSPRLVCIAGDFNKYDEHAVQQINRNIELLRYRWYDEGYLILELVNAVTGTPVIIDPIGESGSTGSTRPSGSSRSQANQKYVTDYLAQASIELQNLYSDLEAQLSALGDDVQQKTLKYYFAFKRIKNFACIEVHPQSQRLLVYLKVDPTTVALEPGFTRDVTKIGHFGTGDLEVSISSHEDLRRCEGFFLTSYENS